MKGNPWMISMGATISRKMKLVEYLKHLKVKIQAWEKFRVELEISTWKSKVIITTEQNTHAHRETKTKTRQLLILGGVTPLFRIHESKSNQCTDYDSALNILRNTKIIKRKL